MPGEEPQPRVREHWKLVLVLTLALTVDVMKPATTGFVIPGLTAEYGILWLLGLPAGALIIFLNRFIPESPRFLSNAGLQEQARAVLAKFSGTPALERDDASVTTLATAALLVSSGGVIAMLIPYAAEIYPAHLRGTGAGVIAASSKFGGIPGAGLGVLGLFEHVALSALLIATPMAMCGLMLARNGVETRGRRLEVIQQTLAGTAA